MSTPLMMVHYLLEMGLAGQPAALRLELMVPVEAFPVTKMNAFLSLEEMLRVCGEKQGFKKVEQSLGPEKIA